MVKHLWPLLEISLSDFRRLAKLNIYAYLPNVGRNLSTKICKQFSMKMMSLVQTVAQPEEGGHWDFTGCGFGQYWPSGFGISLKNVRVFGFWMLRGSRVLPFF